MQVMVLKGEKTIELVFFRDERVSSFFFAHLQTANRWTFSVQLLVIDTLQVPLLWPKLMLFPWNLAGGRLV